MVIIIKGKDPYKVSGLMPNVMSKTGVSLNIVKLYSCHMKHLITESTSSLRNIISSSAPWC